MSQEFTATIKTTDLKIGTTLSFDLTDANGAVLHKAGMPISERLLERLASRGIHSLKIIGRAPSTSKPASEVLLSAYDNRVVTGLQTAASKAETSLRDLAFNLKNGGDVDVREVKSSVNSFLEQATQDASAALAVVAMRASVKNSDLSHKLSNRSANMALLAVTTSVVMGCSSLETIDVGTAGLLHDCSLLANADRLESAERQSPRILLELRNHSLDSAESIKGSSGVSDRVCLALSQVHEQFDGSGYPRGTAGSQILTAAKILNLADAYLSMVQPVFQKTQYLPSDALAHLCHHAALRRFDPQVVRAFVAGLSMYPIGSAVSLDNAADAVIVRSNANNPLKPVVKLTGGNNELIDLSKSDHSIRGPSANVPSSVQRISKVMMDNQLWRDDVGVHGT